MRVLMYGWEFPPYINGGLGVACHGIVESLLKNQIPVSLVLPKIQNEFEEKDRKTGKTLELKDQAIFNQPGLFNIKYIPSCLSPYMTHKTYLKSIDGLIHKNKYGSDLISEVIRFSKEAGKIANDTKHDIIHAHDWLTVLAGIEARALSHKPLIYHVHALETDRSGIHCNPAIFEIEKKGLIQADKIIAVSEYTKKSISDFYHISKEKISVIYNGLRETQLLNTSKVDKAPLKTILFLGRITHQKGPFYFIEAAKKILSVRHDVQFIMAGTGDLLHSMIEKVAELRLGRHIHFTGFLDRTSVERMYAGSHVYVMPSVSEPFGISCLEAVSQSLPAIISHQSGAAEVLNHVLKVDFWDVDELASKIIGLLDQTALSLEMTKNSKQDLNDLLWDKSTKGIIDIYKKTFQERSA